MGHCTVASAKSITISAAVFFVPLKVFSEVTLPTYLHQRHRRQWDRTAHGQLAGSLPLHLLEMFPVSKYKQGSQSGVNMAKLSWPNTPKLLHNAKYVLLYNTTVTCH